MGRKKKTCKLEFKKKCIAELLGGKDFFRVCADNGVAPSTLSDWKQQVLEGMGSSKKSIEEKKIIEDLRKELERAQRLFGKKEMENELLKKSPAALNTVDLCRLADEDSSVLLVSEQCRILGLPRSSYYKKRGLKDEIAIRDDSEHAAHCDILLGRWTDVPTYGHRKMSNDLLRSGLGWATEHEVRKIYGELGLKGMSPAFKTTRPAKGRYKHPYLIRGRIALYCNEIWASDISYIKLGDRMVYFTAIIDLRRRKSLTILNKYPIILRTRHLR